ncbi:unnamed protein product [Candidula unifasciata]|uniref:DNA oxidative demethylase ALKBH2 n=1 Tax=Candidula unifasciata TaxID=100452 RepID=A0A8S3ZNQ5_9EUPU|nr:unnamed protein product [Candidula unifasciata]
MSQLIVQRKRQKKSKVVSVKCFILDNVEKTLEVGNKKDDISRPQESENAVTPEPQGRQEQVQLQVVSHLAADFLNYKWVDITREGLCLQLTQLYCREDADTLLTLCEQELVYNEGDLATVKLFGKRIQIPRKQVAHGNTGLTYTFSGNTIPARPWTPLLMKIRDHISAATGYQFNFVLINRYKDGHDYMGEHKDDEKDLFPGFPIASLSLGQPRDFVFRHQDSRGKDCKRKIAPVSLTLEHGVLLLMKHPTNSFWYHSLPRRTRALGVRVNLTFRKMQPSHSKHA